MDLAERTTRRSLVTMSDDKVKERFLNKSYNHKHWYSRSGHQDQEQYLKARLIMLMEHDLDCDFRATKSELLDMDSQTIDKYFAKVHSAHEVWWNAEDALARKGYSDHF